MDRNWQLSAKGMSDRNAMMLANKELSDCAFLVGSTQGEEMRFDAHKFVLASASSVFQAMFYGALKETNTPIVVTDMEGSTFQALLDYIYTECDLDGTLDEALKLWAAAEKYQIPPLISKCVAKLIETMDQFNVFKLLQYAFLYSNNALEKKCIKFFGFKATLKSADFERLPMNFFLKLLDLKPLKGDASEMDLYQALERWAKAECCRKELPETKENLRLVSGDVVKKIRFLTMSPDEFTAGSLLMLFDEEYLPILVNVLSQNKSYANKTPLPSGFSASRTPRFLDPLPVIRLVTEIQVNFSNVATAVTSSQGYVSRQSYGIPTMRYYLSFTLPVDASSFRFETSSVESSAGNSFTSFTAYLYRSGILLASVKVEMPSYVSAPCVSFPLSSNFVLEKGVKYSIHIDEHKGALYSLKNIITPWIPFGSSGQIFLSDLGETVIRRMSFLV